MRSTLAFSVLLFAALFAFAAQDDRSVVEKTDPQPADKSPFVGLWRVEGMILSDSKNKKETFNEKNTETIIAVFTENTLTLQVGGEKFAAMSYTFNPKQIPAAFDAKYDGRDIQGIYELQDDYLFLRLNDAPKDRPKSIDDKDVGIYLDLARVKCNTLVYLDATGAEAGHLPPAFDYDNCGSPRWSHDGSKIVYDAWHSWDGGSSNMSHVILVNSDGTSLKDLGRGALPSISPDGKRITYSQYDNNHGVWVMNIDGTAPKLLETIAWCSDWVSNDEVIYSTYGEDGINFRVENLTTGESRLLLSKTRYRQIYWGFGTSPDGKWVAFKGDLADGSGEELAVVNTEGKGKGFKVLLPGNTAKDVNYFDHYVNWTPDGKRLVALLSTKTRPNQQMYYLDLEGDNPPEWLSGQIPLRQFYCSTFSPDGKRLATMGRVIKPAIKNEKAEEAAP